MNDDIIGMRCDTIWYGMARMPGFRFLQQHLDGMGWDGLSLALLVCLGGRLSSSARRFWEAIWHTKCMLLGI